MLQSRQCMFTLSPSLLTNYFSRTLGTSAITIRVASTRTVSKAYPLAHSHVQSSPMPLAAHTDDLTLKLAATGVRLWGKLISLRNDIATGTLKLISKIPAGDGGAHAAPQPDATPAEAAPAATAKAAPTSVASPTAKAEAAAVPIAAPAKPQTKAAADKPVATETEEVPVEGDEQGDDEGNKEDETF